MEVWGFAVVYPTKKISRYVYEFCEYEKEGQVYKYDYLGSLSADSWGSIKNNFDCSH